MNPDSCLLKLFTILVPYSGYIFNFIPFSIGIQYIPILAYTLSLIVISLLLYATYTTSKNFYKGVQGRLIVPIAKSSFIFVLSLTFIITNYITLMLPVYVYNIYINAIFLLLFILSLFYTYHEEKKIEK